MSERIQATVSVAMADAPVLQKALADAQAAAGNHRFTATLNQPNQASVVLEADDHATLVAGIEAIGPVFARLGGRATVSGVAFTPGVKDSVRARVGGLAQHPAAL